MYTFFYAVKKTVYMWLNNAPMFLICLCFIVGISFSKFFESYYQNKQNLFILLSVFTCIILCSSYLISRIKIGLFLIYFIVFGLVYPFFSLHINKPIIGSYNGICIIKSIGKEKKKTYAYEAEIHLENSANSYKTILYFAKDSITKHFNYNDVICIKTTCKEIQNQENSSFDYKNFCNKRGIYSTAYVSLKNFKLIKKSHSLHTITYSIQQSISSYIKSQHISQISKEILCALIVGDKSILTDSTKAMFINTGTMHVLAVSGLHVGVISGILLLILNIIFKNSHKTIKLCIAIGGIWFFAFITGLSPSVLRAAIMFSMISICTITNRKILSFNIIGTAAFIAVLLDYTVIYDLGFQLSFIAVLSIITGNSILPTIRYRNTVLKYIFEIIKISAIVSIGSLAIGSYYFSSIQAFSLLSNLLVIPITSIVMFLAIFSSLKLPYFAEYIFYSIDQLLLLMTKLLPYFEKLPYSKISYKMSGNQMFWYYTVLICIVIGVRIFKTRKS